MQNIYQMSPISKNEYRSWLIIIGDDIALIFTSASVSTLAAFASHRYWYWRAWDQVDHDFIDEDIADHDFYEYCQDIYIINRS